VSEGGGGGGRCCTTWLIRVTCCAGQLGGSGHCGRYHLAAYTASVYGIGVEWGGGFEGGPPGPGRNGQTALAQVSG
jgi:hypothetical protein